MIFVFLKKMFSDREEEEDLLQNVVNEVRHLLFSFPVPILLSNLNTLSRFLPHRPFKLGRC